MEEVPSAILGPDPIIINMVFISLDLHNSQAHS